jgi:hypothetical protein
VLNADRVGENIFSKLPVCCGMEVDYACGNILGKRPLSIGTGPLFNLSEGKLLAAVCPSGLLPAISSKGSTRDDVTRRSEALRP